MGDGGTDVIDVIRQQFTPEMNVNDRLNKAREFLQILCLKIMGDKGMFEDVAFLGGTALRVLFDLRRFSEDMDFSLIPGKKLELNKIQDLFYAGFKSYGIPAEIKSQSKNAVQSVWLKFPAILKDLNISPLAGQKLSIKWDTDTNPPKGAVLAHAIINKFFMFRVVHYDLPSLFAGKLHACLFRNYAKGRDWYDFVWYVSKKIRPNLVLLQNAIKQTEGKEIHLTEPELTGFLLARIEKVNFDHMKQDVERFVEDIGELSIFDKDAIAQAVRMAYEFK